MLNNEYKVMTSKFYALLGVIYKIFEYARCLQQNMGQFNIYSSYKHLN